jgi:hypothetical protein
MASAEQVVTIKFDDKFIAELTAALRKASDRLEAIECALKAAGIEVPQQVDDED